jgi:predicted nucleic acid-binding protein
MIAEPVLLDTDTLSELSRGNKAVKAQALAYLAVFGRLTITAVTVFERMRGYRIALRSGKAFEHHIQAFQALVAACVVLPFDEGAASIAADIWAAAPRRMRSQLSDILIAATAVSRRLPLATRNKRDFEALAKASGLPIRVVDWSAGAT